VDDFRHSVRAVGRGKISKTIAEVHLVESQSQTRVSLRASARGAEGEARITLSLNRLDFHFIVDKKVLSLMEELQRLSARGASDAQLRSLTMELDKAMHISSGYKPFVAQVKNSPVFNIVTTVRSLVAAVPPEDVEQNLGLALILYASRFLAPSTTYSPASADVTKVKWNGQIIRIGHSGTTFYGSFRKGVYSSNLSLAQGGLYACFQICNHDFQTCRSNCTLPGPLDPVCEVWCFTVWVWCIIDCII